MGRCLRPALTPDFQVVEHTIAARALQGFGVAHYAGLVTCDHPVVAGGTAVAAAVHGGGSVRRDGGVQVLHSGDLFLVWFFVSCALDRTKATKFAQIRGYGWSRAGMFSHHGEQHTR